MTHPHRVVLEYFHTLESTNDLAKSRWRLEPERFDGHVFFANQQTKGRGAHGRTWDSPPDLDIYVSLCRKVISPMHPLPNLTLAIGAAVAKTVDITLDRCVAEIKWPNDILLGGRKCAGILVETVTRAHEAGCIAGIGLNVNRTVFPDAYPAVSLSGFCHKHFDRFKVLNTLLHQVTTTWDRFSTHGFAALHLDIESKMAWRHQKVRVGNITGTFLGIDADGFALLDTPTGPQRMMTGTMRAMCGGPQS